MITDAVLLGLSGFLTTLFDWLPTWTYVPEPTGEDGSGIVTLIGSANNVFPVLTIVQVLTAATVVRFALYTWDFIVWVYHQFWGSS